MSAVLLRSRRIPAAVYAPVALSIAGLAALVFSEVDIHVVGTGSVRPVSERIALMTPVAGIVRRSLGEGERFVRKGDVILEIEQPGMAEQGAHLGEELRDTEQRLADLRALMAALGNGANGDRGLLRGIRTTSYLSEWEAWGARWAAAGLRRDQLHASRERADALRAARAIAEAEYERATADLAGAQSAVDGLYAEMKARWEAEIERLQSLSRRLDSQRALLAARLGEGRMVAPADGELVGFREVPQGAFVPAHVMLGELSPGNDLMVEAVLPSRDIGGLAVGTPAAIRFDAFPYAQWGHAPGRIRRIAGDVSSTGGAPAYVVRVTLDRVSMGPEGSSRPILKGMSAQLLFATGRQRLWKLWVGSVVETMDPRNPQPLFQEILEK